MTLASVSFFALYKFALYTDKQEVTEMVTSPEMPLLVR